MPPASCGPTENPNVIRNIKTEYQFQSNEYILATGLVCVLPRRVHGLPVEKGYWLGFTMETGDTVCPSAPTTPERMRSLSRAFGRWALMSGQKRTNPPNLLSNRQPSPCRWCPDDHDATLGTTCCCRWCCALLTRGWKLFEVACWN